MKRLIRFVNDRPWIYVVAGFLLLIAAYATLITITARNSPQRIEVKPAAGTVEPAANPDPP